MEQTFVGSWQNAIQFLTAGLTDWGGLHPVLVHFPVSLLSIAPLFIVIGLFTKKSAKTFYVCALVLLLTGTAGAYLAETSGEKASEAVSTADGNETLATLRTHAELAEKATLHFSILTALFLVYVLFYTLLNGIFGPRIHQLGLILFLAAYAYSLLILANTAHHGGMLVHHHGVQSKLFSNVDQTTKSP